MGFYGVPQGATRRCPEDYNSIQERIRWACHMFDVRSVMYDKWNFRATGMDLLDEGLPVVEVWTGWKLFSGGWLRTCPSNGN